MADKKISQLTAATTPLAGTEVLPIVQSGSTVKVAVSNLTAGRTVSASVLNPAVGSVGTPSISFATDSSSGFYRNSPNTVSFSSSGAEALAIGPNLLSLAGGVIGGSGFQSYGFSAFRASGAGVSSPGDASMYFNATTGQTFQARAGSSYDWSLLNPGNANYIARVPTGTLDFDVANGNVKFSTAAKGIDFSANTGAAGETSALLNWYEEGTWTPTANNLVVVGDPTYTGRYTRIGRVVYIELRVASTTSTAATAGSTFFGGLPFTPANGATISFANANATDSYGTNLLWTDGRIYCPTWAATATVIASGFYFV